MSKRLIKNKLQCNKCKDIIQSTNTHDFKFCKCGAIAVDGGLDYARRVGAIDNYLEMSEYSEDEVLTH